jgi:hypothetical protein
MFFTRHVRPHSTFCSSETTRLLVPKDRLFGRNSAQWYIQDTKSLYRLEMIDRVTGRASLSTHVVRLRSADGYNIVNEHRLATVFDGLWFSDGMEVAGSRVHVSN